MPDPTYNVNHRATLGQLKAAMLRVQGTIPSITTETWTFVLDDANETEVTKEVAAWSSGT